MRPTLVALALSLAACVSGTPLAEVPPRSGYDLTDPELVAELGAPPIEGVEWRREIEETEVLGVSTRPDPTELELIGAALQEVPGELAELVAPRAIVRVPEGELGDDLHPEALAFSKGPDVFLIDRLFDQAGTRFGLARAYLHELAHVAQFRALSDDYVTAVLEGEVTQVAPQAGSTLVRDFAAAVGWVDESDDPLSPQWLLPAGSSPATEYGSIGPHEDMAEAVALVTLGRAEHLPDDRRAWVEGWLGAPAEALATGKPWSPPGSTEVLAANPLYDQERVKELTTGLGHIEPFYFALPTDVEPAEPLARAIEERLAARGLAGSLAPADDNRLPRHVGEFTRPDGVTFRVELWDFREAEGFDSAPDHPILTYVVFW